MMGARRGLPLPGGSPASGGRRMEPSPLHPKNQAAEPQVRPADEPAAETRPQGSGLSEEESQFRVTHSWEAEGIEPTPSVIPTIDFPWVTERLLRGELTKFSRPAALPAWASP